jgi:ribonuclease J
MPIRVTHSLVDCVALAIHTPVGIVVHTGDFKIDLSSPDGKPFDLHRFAEYGKRGVLALLQDSTNVDRPGYTPSERAVKPRLDEIFGQHQEEALLQLLLLIHPPHPHRHGARPPARPQGRHRRPLDA